MTSVNVAQQTLMEAVQSKYKHSLACIHKQGTQPKKIAQQTNPSKTVNDIEDSDSQPAANSIAKRIQVGDKSILKLFW